VCCWDWIWEGGGDEGAGGGEGGGGGGGVDVWEMRLVCVLGEVVGGGSVGEEGGGGGRRGMGEGGERRDGEGDVQGRDSNVVDSVRDIVLVGCGFFGGDWG
jgi:hypothetical protein